MKLFAKYNRLNILATIVIFVIGSCTFYLVLNYILVRQVDSGLVSEKEEIRTFNRLHGALPEIVNTKDQIISYSQADKIEKTSYRNITIRQKHDESFRSIQFNVDVNGTNYVVTVNKSLEETEDLLEAIIIVTIAMIALILLVGYFINRAVLGKLWQPFYNTIQKIQNYSIAQKQEIIFPETEIDEFTLLNRSIALMTRRAQDDYQSLKEFTGHAAHEIQTPLAIMRNRLDMLIQDEALLQQHAQPLVDIEKAVNRLSKLHQSLLLLTKVEHRQFLLDEEVEMSKIVKDKVYEYRELAGARSLNIEADLQETKILFHQHLAEILVGNLVNNAIRYNVKEGGIFIKLTNERLEIANTSSLHAIDKQHLFQRFYRDPMAKEEGTGLGLTIAKQICDMAGFNIGYKFVEDMHVFVVTFRKPS